MIKAVIFDCYGVLVEDSWLAFLHKYGGGPNDEQLHHLNKQQDLGRIPFNDFLEQVSHLTDVNLEQAKQIITAQHHLNEPLVNLIKQLKPSYKIGMISNIGHDIGKTLPKDIIDLFDDITLSYEAGALKPESAIYLLALNKLGVTASEAIFIDDRQYNCDGAIAIGIQTVLYKNPKQTIEDLAKLGVKTG